MRSETDLVKLTAQIRRAQAQIDSMTTKRQRILAKQQAADVLDSESDGKDDSPSDDTAAEEAKALKVIEQYKKDPKITKADRKLMKGACVDKKKQEKKDIHHANALAKVDNGVNDSDDDLNKNVEDLPLSSTNNRGKVQPAASNDVEL